MGTLLALDVGFAKIGYVVLTKDSNLLHSGIITTSNKDTVSVRLKKIFNSLKKIIIKYKVSTVALEELYLHKISKRTLSSFYVLGVILLLAGIYLLQVEHHNPKQIKKYITGYGFADKTQIKNMLIKIGFTNLPKQQDIIDALAIGLYHLKVSNLKKCYHF